MAKTFGLVTPSYTALFDQGLKIELYDSNFFLNNLMQADISFQYQNSCKFNI